MNVSIVICCYNSSSRISATLGFLKRQRVSSQILWEVILVDNNCTDSTVATARQEWGDYPMPLHVVSECVPGQMHARLKGASVATGDVLGFVDDDNWISCDWIANVVKCFNQYADVGILGSHAEVVEEGEFPAWFERFKISYAIGPQAAAAGELPVGHAVYGAGMAVRRKVWDAIFKNGFKPLVAGRTEKALGSGDDVEICLLAQVLGWRIAYVPELKLLHFVPRDRRNWGYLERLAAGNGQADVRLSLYRVALSTNSDFQIFVFSSWMFLIPYRFIQYLLAAGKSLFAIKGEGSALSLNRIRAQSRFFETVYSRAKLRDWSSVITTRRDARE